MKVFFICCTAVALADGKVYNQGMHLVKPSNMQKAEADELVSVSHCETPIEIEQLGPAPGLVANIYHTSVVFHIPSSNMNSSIEFTADNFGTSIFLPTLSRSASKAPLIEWNNSAAIRSKEGIVDYTYWLRKKELGTISGDKYNKLLEWLALPDTETEFDAYYLFELQDKASMKHASDNTTLVPSCTCYDFVGAALEQLKVEGAQLKAWSGRDWSYSVVKHGAQVKVVNISDPKVNEQLWDYYSNVSLAFEEVESLHPNATNITDIMRAIAQVTALLNNQSHGESFVYANNVYYQFTSTSPFAGYTYS
jgi:hypothetical protein